MFSNLMLCVEFEIRPYWYFSKLLVLRVSAPTRVLEDFSTDITEIKIMYTTCEVYTQIFNLSYCRASRTTRGWDIAIGKFWKICRCEKNFVFLGFLRLKMADIYKTNYFIGSKWYVSYLVRGFWRYFGWKIAKKNRENQIFLKKMFWTIS